MGECGLTEKGQNPIHDLLSVFKTYHCGLFSPCMCEAVCEVVYLQLSYLVLAVSPISAI